MKYNKGFTLVELMVGMLLTSLLMITMLTLFKQVNFIGMNSAEDAEYEAQLEMGLLTIQRLVANAGYGSGLDDDVVIGSYEGNEAIFWRYAEDHEAMPLVMQCRGFGVKIETFNDQFKHRLLLLTAPCTAANLVDEAWVVQQPIATVKSEEDTDPVFTYSLVTGECVPYGIYQGGVSGNKRVVIEGVRKHDFGVGNKRRFVCFNNIKA